MVLDPFLGSGTTCIAAFDLDRKSMGIEIFDEYYGLAKNNIKKHLLGYDSEGIMPLPYAEINISGNI
jgi:DNA modification methylase